jgi:hypothetical protein
MSSDRRLTEKAVNDNKKTREWTVSIACVPGLTAEQTAARSIVVQGYRQMRVATAGPLKAAGYPVESDGAGKTHGVIVLPGKPDARVWNELRALLIQRDNPHYRG